MIRSMTGFGNSSAEYGNKTISAEIRSVNSKFLDLSMKLPQAYREREIELRTELARRLERGKAEVVVTIENRDPAPKTAVNKPLAKAYFKEFKKLDSELKNKTANYLQLVLSMPDVLSGEKNQLDDLEWKAAINCVLAAVNGLDRFRENEGKAVEKDLRERVAAIRKGMEGLAPFEEPRIKNLRKRLEAGLEEFIQANNIDRNRLEQELIFYIEKFDISEEKVRLGSHCDYFLRTIKEEDSPGKKLSFIAQEIGREINTIGSKANDAGMQKVVVEMKDELEKIKEQVLNIL